MSSGTDRIVVHDVLAPSGGIAAMIQRQIPRDAKEPAQLPLGRQLLVNRSTMEAQEDFLGEIGGVRRTDPAGNPAFHAAVDIGRLKIHRKA